MKHVCLLFLGVLLCSGMSGAQAPGSPMPELPSDVPKSADLRVVLNDSTPQGQEAVWMDADGTIREFFQFNDRGRGPKTYTSYRLDADGVVIGEKTSGVNYMKGPISEIFELVGGTASWKNDSEDQKSPNAAGKFYVDLDGGPESQAILARALLKKGGKLNVLPRGEVSIHRLQKMPVAGTGSNVDATLYEISGLSLSPIYLWLDDQLRFFASTPGWFAMVRQGFESAAKTLEQAQKVAESLRSAELAMRLTHKPEGDLIIKNAKVFDSLTGKVAEWKRIIIRAGRIAAVEDERDQKTPPKAMVLDGTNKMALPGLWDMHQHLSSEGAMLDIAAGITTVRDLGNAPDDLAKLRERIPEKQIGPRTIAAGFIDGRGPFQGPIAIFADTPEEARAQVNKYADLGYVQIKIYSSMKPELVPIIAQEAHRLGLRVSGHVPANMIAEQFVAAGADEIQHINFIMLNFWPDLKETRNRNRLIVPAERSAELDLDSAEVSRFIGFLKEHKTVVDPTMVTFEGDYLGRPGKVGAADVPMFDRMPVQVQRAIRTGGGALPVKDDATDRLYRASWANIVRMLKRLYDGGVQIVPGTDQGNGYALHRELEIYSEAGIPATEILQIATIKAARVMRRDDELGSITVGKHADIILVNGDPTKRLSDVRNVETVIQNGNILRPAELYSAIGIRAN